jgi:hypothetical protein
VRELSDGRVLIVDGRERTIHVADLRMGSLAPVGRSGDGPGEYRQVAAPLRLGGDTALIISASDRRWFLLAGPRILRTLPADDAAVVTASNGALAFTAAINGLALQADTIGFLLTHGGPPPMMVAREASPRDSLAVVRIGRASGRGDTITWIQRRPTSSRTTTGPGGAPGVRNFNPPWAVGEQAVLAADGWIAIVRLNPYRVEWRAPDGRWTRGAPLPFPAIRVTARERDAFVANPGADGTRPDGSDWPAVVPPIGHDGRFTAMADLGGHVIVHHTAGIGEAIRRYDVIDRTGQLVRQVSVPKDHRLIGFGRGTAYTIRTEEDGLQYLQRHPWP